MENYFLSNQFDRLQNELESFKSPPNKADFGIGISYELGYFKSSNN